MGAEQPAENKETSAGVSSECVSLVSFLGSDRITMIKEFDYGHIAISYT